MTMPAQFEVRLPELADAMASATLTTWLKQPGDVVTMGEPIAEVETDKTTVELEAPADGVLESIRVPAGTASVPVGAVLAVVREAEDSPTATASGTVVRDSASSAEDRTAVPPGRDDAAAVRQDAAARTRASDAPALVEVRLPELADGMTAATLTAWLKAPGEPVTAGEPIVEVETDKTTVELEAPADGVFESIRVAAGAAGVAVGTVLALVRGGRPGGGSTRPDAATASGPRDARPRLLPDQDMTAPAPGTDAVGATAASRGDDTTRPAPAVGVSTVTGDLAGDAGPGHGTASGTGVSSADTPATPLARRMATLAGIDLATVTGAGAGGRVMKADVEHLLRSVIARTSPIDAPRSDAPHTDRPLTAMRRVTAQRMAESKQSAPHFYLEIECAVDRLLARRAAEGDGAPTVNDLVVRAAALALRDAPLANSAWTGSAVRVYDRVDLAVAVATPAGLVTPVVRAADTKPLAVIAAELRQLMADARAGRLQPADYQGGTCTISNLGMYGVSSLYAILNPPQSCILGIGAIVERPVVRDGGVTVGSMMTVTLSADHRAIDGAAGAELLRVFRAILGDPQRVFA